MVETLASTTDGVLKDCPSNLWPTLRLQLTSAADSSAGAIRTALEPLGVSAGTVSAAEKRVADAARAVVEERARKAARQEGALERMRERFAAAFSRDERGYPRTWWVQTDATQCTHPPVCTHPAVVLCAV